MRSGHSLWMKKIIYKQFFKNWFFRFLKKIEIQLELVCQFQHSYLLTKSNEIVQESTSKLECILLRNNVNEH